MSKIKRKVFAYDQNSRDGIACPALVAGFNPEDSDLIHVVEWYDEKAHQLSTDDHVIGREKAQEAWEWATDQLRDDIDDPSLDPADRRASERAVELAEEVSEKVF